MMDSLIKLIDSLRAELREYGEMLALLDQQQQTVIARAADEVLHTAAAIVRQCANLRQSRDLRENCRREMAQALRLRGEATFAEITPRLPQDYQGLISALVEENNHLLLRIQQRSRQNHLLLSRSLDLMQQCLGTLFPGARPTVYNGGGAVSSRTPNGRSLYEAVG